ncbi:TPA: hypothetical protein DDW35_08640, partial [Candidatus Sumerlaeota bacterium]|nr:hypothetical protein [Candidatus Sumerlaeota bacterium]
KEATKNYVTLEMNCSCTSPIPADSSDTFSFTATPKPGAPNPTYSWSGGSPLAFDPSTGSSISVTLPSSNTVETTTTVSVTCTCTFDKFPSGATEADGSAISSLRMPRESVSATCSVTIIPPRVYWYADPAPVVSTTFNYDGGVYKTNDAYGTGDFSSSSFAFTREDYDSKKVRSVKTLVADDAWLETLTDQTTTEAKQTIVDNLTTTQNIKKIIANMAYSNAPVKQTDSDRFDSDIALQGTKHIISLDLVSDTTAPVDQTVTTSIKLIATPSEDAPHGVFNWTSSDSDIISVMDTTEPKLVASVGAKAGTATITCTYTFHVFPDGTQTLSGAPASLVTDGTDKSLAVQVTASVAVTNITPEPKGKFKVLGSHYYGPASNCDNQTQSIFPLKAGASADGLTAYVGSGPSTVYSIVEVTNLAKDAGTAEVEGGDPNAPWKELTLGGLYVHVAIINMIRAAATPWQASAPTCVEPVLNPISADDIISGISFDPTGVTQYFMGSGSATVKSGGQLIGTIVAVGANISGDTNIDTTPAMPNTTAQLSGVLGGTVAWTGMIRYERGRVAEFFYNQPSPPVSVVGESESTIAPGSVTGQIKVNGTLLPDTYRFNVRSSNGRYYLRNAIRGSDDSGVSGGSSDANTPWPVFQGSSAIRGGTVELVYTYTPPGGSAATGKCVFDVRGTNPSQAQYEAYVASLQGDYWFYKGMIWHESNGGQQFERGGTLGPNWANLNVQGCPFFGFPNGWGLCQRDAAEPKDEASPEALWNWKVNLQVGKSVLDGNRSDLTSGMFSAARIAAAKNSNIIWVGKMPFSLEGGPKDISFTFNSEADVCTINTASFCMLETIQDYNGWPPYLKWNEDKNIYEINPEHSPYVSDVLGYVSNADYANFVDIQVDGVAFNDDDLAWFGVDSVSAFVTQYIMGKQPQ